MKERRVVLFLISILMGLSVFLASYLFIINSEPEEILLEDQSALIARFSNTKETQKNSEILEKLPSENVLFPFLDNRGNIIMYYEESSGNIYQITLGENGFKKSFTHKTEAFMSKLEWSKDGELLLETDNNSKNIIFSFKDGVIKKLPIFERISLSPSGDKLAYFKKNSDGSGNINTNNISLDYEKKVLEVNSAPSELTWVGEKDILLSYVDSLFLLNTETKRLERIVGSKKNIKYSISGNAKNILFSYTDSDNNILDLYDVEKHSSMRLPLNIEATACTLPNTSSSLYCYIKSATNPGFIIFDLNDNTSDHIENKNKKELSPERLLVSTDEQYLFFINALDGNLYRLRIKIKQ